MKFQLLLIALLSALLFTACQPEEEPNCRDAALGLYEGTDNNGEEGSIDIQEGAGEKGTIVVFSSESAGMSFSFTMTGELNENCSVLTVPTQTVGQGTLSGSFVLTSETLDGTITTSNGGSTTQSFALNFDKK